MSSFLYVIFASLIAQSLAWTINYHNTTSCPYDNDCFRNLKIDVGAVDYRDTCKTVFTYKFLNLGSGCELTSFVFDFTGLPSPVLGGCAGSYNYDDNGCTDCRIKTPVKINLNQT